MFFYRSELADKALELVGAPSILYRHHRTGTTPKGFDCSGFVSYVLRRAGFPLDPSIRHVNEFFDRFGIFIHAEAVSRGDLVFWSWDGVIPRHIGIMISHTRFVHAPGTNRTRVGIGTLKTKPIRGLLPYQHFFQNPIGFKRLSLPNGRYQRMLN